MRKLLCSIVFIYCLFTTINAFAACGSGPCVQANSGNNGTANDATIDVVFSGAQTAANLNIVSVAFCGDINCSAGTSGCTVTVTDDSNSYSSAVRVDDSTDGTASTSYAPNISADASNTVHISIGSCSEVWYLAGFISEWSGQATSMVLDQTGTAAGSGNITVSTGMSSAANVLVYGLGTYIGGEVMSADFTEINAVDTNRGDQYTTASMTGVKTLTWTAVGGVTRYVATIATFNNASSATTGMTGLTLGMIGQ